MGHDAGDACLRNVTERLTDAANGHAIVGRIGGDEFLLVQNNARSAADAEKLAERIVREMKRPVVINNHEMDTSVSVGTALFPSDGYSSAELVKSADVALYTAKNNGRGCFRLYKPEFDEKLRRRRLVETKVRQAIEAGSFTLAFQPLLDISSDEVVSVEALIRLEDKELGAISPGEFIPIAEEAGLIEDIGNWVIAEGCKSLALLPHHIKVAVNLSAVQFSRGNLVKIVNDAIRNAGVDAQRLELEITESLLLRNSEEVLEKVERLKALGCSLVLDDFGSGYSSLSYLWRYPFDKIKIDREFVSAMSKNTDVAGIVETVVALGKKLDMKVTAEGVETVEQARKLRELECDQVQGYLYSKPIPLDELAAFLLRHRSKQPLRAVV
jgi:predicted signal transduction protein with EAL and GGDEF domain